MEERIQDRTRCHAMPCHAPPSPAVQERDSSKFMTEQDALLRRCDELSSALAGKQEEATLLTMKNVQVRACTP